MYTIDPNDLVLVTVYIYPLAAAAAAVVSDIIIQIFNPILTNISAIKGPHNSPGRFVFVSVLLHLLVCAITCIENFFIQTI